MAAGFGQFQRGELLRSGLVRKSGNKIKSACRFAINAIDCGSNLSIHKKLFQTEVDYRKNIRSVLEHRLSHLNRFDERLFLMVERSIRSLPDFPEICLNDFSQVSGWAFDIIWQREFGSTARVPQALIEEWTQKYQKFPKPIRVMMDQDNWNIKRDVPTQLAILQLLTGSHQDFQESRAKSTSKDVYVLLNAIHSFRNRSEHDGGQKIPIGVAVSGLMLCIELLACLDCG